MAESDLISVAQAIEIIDSIPVTPRAQSLALEHAQGHRLAQDILADRDYPPFNKSLMDGYAVRSADVVRTPVELTIQGQIAAGQQAADALKPAHAYSIMTGAPIPDGADGIVPVEDSESDAKRVRILRAEGPGKFITRKGADCAKGSVVLRVGTKLEAAQLAVAASVGAAQVEVHAKPRAAVLSTGDELVPFDATPGPAQIRSSNNIMLVALLRRLGCDVTDLGAVRDDPNFIRRAIEEGMKHDVLFVSGGMSMGQFDYVPGILKELAVELKITKLRIKPGKPFVFGLKSNSFVFGLPGNPVSGFVCTLRLCSRLIGRMSGTGPVEKWSTAKLESPLDANGTREFYQPGILSGLTVRPLKWKGSADIYTLAAANCLIVRPENAPQVESGEFVNVLEVPS